MRHRLAAAFLIFAVSASPALAQDNLLRSLGLEGGSSERQMMRRGQSTQAEGGVTAPGAAAAQSQMQGQQGQQQPGAAGTPMPGPVPSTVYPPVPRQGPPAPGTAAGMPSGALLPFGAQLFQGAPPAATSGPNPDYRLSPGDTVAVRLWGSIVTDVTGPIDLAGNVFIPGVGPVKLAGVRAGDLQRTVQGTVQSVYPANVETYASLMDAQQTGVFVTGFVQRPGRHLGTPSESVLDFLIRAGGVDTSRGSYRDITVLRRGRSIAQVDLYGFLLTGTLPDIRFQEGDTIVVGPQRLLVAAEGAVRNNYLFENSGTPLTGAELIQLASPLPAATHAVISGSRDREPFSRYVSLAELAPLTLRDQDRVAFVSDARSPTITVQVEGSRIGPSVLVADRTITLPEILDHIAVDPALADIGSISILRRSVAEQQARAINESLDRLERGLFLGTSITEGESRIKAQEAQMVSDFIQRARDVQPEGRMVVTVAGRPADVRLEDGDVILIPERSQQVLVSGEVMLPQAVLWQEGMRAVNYVERAGGYTERADEGTFMIRRANGEVLTDAQAAIRPGDEVIAMPDLGTRYFQITKDIFQVLYQMALSVRVFFL